MKTTIPEPRAECDECGKSFPSRELKYNGYFDLMLCPVCNRKLAAFQDVHRLRIFVEIQFWAWVIVWSIPLLLLLTLPILAR